MKLDGRQKITISIAAIMSGLAGAWQGHEWVASHAAKHFIGSAYAGELTEQIKSAADAAKQAAQASQSIATELKAHVRAEELRNARAELERYATELSQTQLWEKANGSNELSRKRIFELTNLIARKKQYVECLEAGRSDCLP